MPKPETDTVELPAGEIQPHLKESKPPVRPHPDPDIEAFYAAQELAARASREYLARRRKR